MSFASAFLRPLLVLIAASLPLKAQQQRYTVAVVDDAGVRVAHAVLNVGSSRALIADEQGRLILRGEARDSLRVRARRIGYREYDGWVRRVDSTFVIALARIPQVIGQVVVTARFETPLARSGFYDRAERVRRGAILGEFIPPEEVESRNQALVSNLLQGHRYVRVSSTNRHGRRKPVLLGRGGCPMTIMIDRQVVTDTEQDNVAEDVPTSIMQGTRTPGGPTKLDIDELVDGRAVVAVEIYPSMANAPAELVSVSGRGSCGIVAIWTGSRQ